MEFHWPWAFFLLPLPWIIRAFLPPLKMEQAALKVPSLSPWQLSKNTRSKRQTTNNLSGWLLPLTLWIALVGALARPYQMGEIVQMPVSGRDLMLAVDISQSMEIEDMRLNNKPANRLAVVKQVVSQFIEQRSGDRMGLILFGSNAYLQAPLTFDARTVSTFLNEAQIGLAGKKPPSVMPSA